jgi:hypothetical protein
MRTSTHEPFSRSPSRVNLRSPLSRPSAPQHHRAAAVLALGYGSLEVAVVERMRLDLDRQPLVGGID